MFRIEQDIEDRKAFATRKDHDSPYWSLSIGTRRGGSLESTSTRQIAEAVRAKRFPICLDMTEVTLVAVDIVRFLETCEARGVELVNCSPYIREWLNKKREM